MLTFEGPSSNYAAYSYVLHKDAVLMLAHENVLNGKRPTIGTKPAVCPPLI